MGVSRAAVVHVHGIGLEQRCSYFCIRCILHHQGFTHMTDFKLFRPFQSPETKAPFRERERIKRSGAMYIERWGKS